MSKTVTVKTVGYMVEKMPDKKKEIKLTLDDNDTVADCIVALGLPVEDDYIVMVDGKFKNLDYCLVENETVLLMYLMFGG